jgi:hypothetical protein
MYFDKNEIKKQSHTDNKENIIKLFYNEPFDTRFEYEGNIRC